MHTCYPFNIWKCYSDIFPNKFWKYQVDRGNLFYYEIHPLSRLTIMSHKAKKVQGECDHYCEFILLEWTFS